MAGATEMSPEDYIGPFLNSSVDGAELTSFSSSFLRRDVRSPLHQDWLVLEIRGHPDLPCNRKERTYLCLDSLSVIYNYEWGHLTLPTILSWSE